MLLGELVERLADFRRARGAGNAKLQIGVARQGGSSRQFEKAERFN
jgi:hypothetical protein